MTGAGKASARGADYCNIGKIIEQIDLDGFQGGGHANAAGFSLKDLSQVEELERQLISLAKLQDEKRKQIETLYADAEVKIEELKSRSLGAGLLALEPWGAGFERPRLLVPAAQVIDIEEDPNVRGAPVTFAQAGQQLSLRVWE